MQAPKWLLNLSNIIRSIPSSLKTLRNKVTNTSSLLLSKCTKSVNLINAKFWVKVYYYGEHLRNLIKNNIILIIVTIFFVFSLCCLLMLELFAKELLNQLVILETAKNFFFTVGGALIGTTVIMFTFVLFAMQINVERMPYGLFRKINSDLILFFCFLSALTLSIAITSLGFISKNELMAYAIFFTIWSLIAIILILWATYKRALNLINPAYQVSFITDSIDKYFRMIDRAISRTKPIIENNINQKVKLEGSSHDIVRLMYFRSQIDWTSITKYNIDYCNTYVLRYSTVGDNEVAQIALNGILYINEKYIKIKNKTFFSHDFLLGSPLSTEAADDVINHTLETLKQTFLIAAANKNEALMISVIKTYNKLCSLYLNIDYSNDLSSKYHAWLVSTYLSSSLKDISRSYFPNVLSQGIELLGRNAVSILEYDTPSYVLGISENISTLAILSLMQRDYLGVTMMCIRQLVLIEIYMIVKARINNIYGDITQVRDDIKIVALSCLEANDHPLARYHSRYLSPYYSLAERDSLPYLLHQLIIELKEEKTDKEPYSRIIHHIVQWSEHLDRTERAIFIKALEKKSSLTRDIINWINYISKTLITLANTEICSPSNRKKLTHNTKLLVNIYNSYDFSKNNISVVEPIYFIDAFFSVAKCAHANDNQEILNFSYECIFDWALYYPSTELTYLTQEYCLYALMILDFIQDRDSTFLNNKTQEWINGPNAPSQDIKDKIITNINEKISSTQDAFSLFEIEMEMANINQDILLERLENLVDIFK